MAQVGCAFGVYAGALHLSESVSLLSNLHQVGSGPSAQPDRKGTLTMRPHLRLQVSCHVAAAALCPRQFLHPSLTTALVSARSREGPLSSIVTAPIEAEPWHHLFSAQTARGLDWWTSMIVSCQDTGFRTTAEVTGVWICIANRQSPGPWRQRSQSASLPDTDQSPTPQSYLVETYQIDRACLTCRATCSSRDLRAQS